MGGVTVHNSFQTYQTTSTSSLCQHEQVARTLAMLFPEGLTNFNPPRHKTPFDSRDEGSK
jgi:hypothetical protein